MQKKAFWKRWDAQWVALACVIAFFMTQFAYNDCVVLLRCSVNFWHALFDGIPMNFYQYGRFIEHTTTFPSLIPGGAAYPLLAYLPTSIYCFPLYLLERFANVDLFANAWAVMYLKAGLILASCVSAFLIRRILLELDVRREVADIAPLLYLSAALFFVGTVVVGQLEAITVLLMLLGYRAFYQRKTAPFVAYFALALSFKYFAIFAFVPLLLLYEKNLWRIVRNGALAILPTLLVFLLTRQDINARVGKIADYTGTLFTENYFLTGWFPETSYIPFGNGTVNLLLLGLIALCLYCYLQRPQDRRQLAYYGAFAGFAAYVLFAFTPPMVFPYWPVLLTPFAVLLLCLNEREIARNIVIETIAASAYVVWQEIVYYWCFGIYAMQNNIFLVGKTIPEEVADYGLNHVFGIIYWRTGMSLEPFARALLYCAAIVGFGYLVYALAPRKADLAHQPPEENGNLRGIIWLRIACGALLLAMPVAVIYYALLC